MRCLSTQLNARQRHTKGARAKMGKGTDVQARQAETKQMRRMLEKFWGLGNLAQDSSGHELHRDGRRLEACHGRTRHPMGSKVVESASCCIPGNTET
jgi:hypothetical protein